MQIEQLLLFWQCWLKSSIILLHIVTISASPQTETSTTIIVVVVAQYGCMLYASYGGVGYCVLLLWYYPSIVRELFITQCVFCIHIYYNKLQVQYIRGIQCLIRDLIFIETYINSLLYRLGKRLYLYWAYWLKSSRRLRIKNLMVMRHVYIYTHRPIQ